SAVKLFLGEILAMSFHVPFEIGKEGICIVKSVFIFLHFGKQPFQCEVDSLAKNCCFRSPGGNPEETVKVEVERTIQEIIKRSDIHHKFFNQRSYKIFL